MGERVALGFGHVVVALDRAFPCGAFIRSRGAGEFAGA